MKNLIIIIPFLLPGCDSSVATIEKHTNVLYKNYYDGHKARVEQYVSVTKYRYSILGRNRVDSLDYTYGVYWSPDDVIWNENLIKERDGTRYYKGEFVPKMMIPCHGRLFLEYNIDSGYIYKGGQFSDGIVREFVEHVDDRYLFKYFGKQYWVAINEQEFNKGTKSCEPYKLPNNF